MTTCERCGTENLEGAQYCDECGATLISRLPRAANPHSMSSSSSHAPNNPRAGGQQSAPAENADLVSALSSGRQSEFAGRTSERSAFAAAEPFKVRDAHAKLVIQRGRSAGKEFLLNDDEMQIGRWDADGGIFPDVDLDADDPEAKVSRRHARITHRGHEYFIEDLGSTNGTFINRGRRLLPGDRQPLRDGDEIIVGKTFLRFYTI